MNTSVSMQANKADSFIHIVHNGYLMSSIQSLMMMDYDDKLLWTINGE